jgi:lycopene cyclase domain-containing protein
MPVQLTYLDFLAVFVLLPLSLLAVAAVVQRRPRRPDIRVRAGGIALLVGLALVYTTPWDNYLIVQGVWWYGEGRVAATLLHAPVGEYLFIVLQTVLVGAWTFQRAGPVDPTVGHSWRDRTLGVLAGLAVALAGVLALAGPESLFYLGAILLWASPVLALQWGVGWRYLLSVRRRVAAAVFPPVLYFSIIDRIAIEQGIWTLSPVHTTGLTVGGLPIEEMLFFFITSLFVAQALVLLRWVIARWG